MNRNDSAAWPPTEMMINLSLEAIRRIGGHLTSATPNEKTMLRLDEALGGAWWRDELANGVSPRAVQVVVTRFAEQLGADTRSHVVVVPVLRAPGQQPVYYLVFCTRHARGVWNFGHCAAQATEEQRRAVADVWLDNSGSPGALVEQARGLWHGRILPFAHNLRLRRPAQLEPAVVPSDPSWPDQARRIVARLQTSCGHRAVRVDHIGSTAVPGLDAKDVIDVQVTVASLEVADELAEGLLAAGYPRVAAITADNPHSADTAQWHKRFHASADPGRPTHVHIRVDGWPNQRFALMCVDWLKANPGVQQDYLAAKRAALRTPDYAEAKEPWFLDAYHRAWEWAESTVWRP
ncbi:MAG: dephospho-CoA kinase [Mycolicibacterium frederiksbergense]|nr:dephospho-CoA kinase [Mycolicibacterium frederiksbergense]